MLNGLWLGFFIVAAVSALAQWLIGGNAGIFAAMVESIFAMAKLSVEVMVLLFGTLTLWLGFLRIAEKAGIVEWLAKALGPLFLRLMPEVPAGHPAIGLITLNFAANGLGLDNAATPIGLKAMKALQELNPSATIASNAQILFLVLNASSLTLLPVTIFMYRAQQGAPDPTLVFLPILLATSCSTLVGLLSVAVMQRLRLWDPVVLAYLIPGALAPGWLHGAAGDALGDRSGRPVVDPRQPDAVRADHAVSGDRCAAQGEGLRGLRRRRQRRLRRGQEPAAVSGGDALCGRRAAGVRGAGLWPGRDSASGGVGRLGHALRRCACRPRWSSRSRAARPGRC